MDFPWYQKLSKGDFTLEQGDLIPNCPLIVPPSHTLKPDDLVSTTVTLIDAIVLSQSCDLANGKVELVLMGSYFTLTDFLNGYYQGKERKAKDVESTIKKIKDGQYHGYHLLNKSKDCVDQYLVVDFRNVYSIHIEVLKPYVKDLIDRVRLLPPYREHLSQSFARFFMRVGLPQDFVIEGF